MESSSIWFLKNYGKCLLVKKKIPIDSVTLHFYTISRDKAAISENRLKKCLFYCDLKWFHRVTGCPQSLDVFSLDLCLVGRKIFSWKTSRFDLISHVWLVSRKYISENLF